MNLILTKAQRRRAEARGLIATAPKRLQPVMLELWGYDGELPGDIKHMLVTGEYGHPGHVYLWHRQGQGFSFISSKTSKKYTYRWLKDDWPRKGVGEFPDGTRPAGHTSETDHWEILEVCASKLAAETQKEWYRRRIYGGAKGGLDE